MRRHLISLAGVLGLLALLGSVAPTPAAALQTVAGQVPAAIQQLGLQPIGELPATQQLRLAIGLPLRNTDALDKLIKDLSNPSSPRYRQYLSLSEFTDQFGPTVDSYQAVASFAAANGLTVSATTPNRVVLDVVASVADIEKAFHVRLLTYNHPTENRTFYAPDTNPTLDLATTVAAIDGLDNYILPHPNVHPVGSLDPNKPMNGSGLHGGYMGKDFRNAYVPGVPQQGAGQTVGLLEFDSGFYQSDISSYEAAAGISPITITPVLIDGYGGGPGSGNIEVSLDIEMAVSMAEGLSSVRVYEGDAPNDILSAMVADSYVKQFGASWSYSANVVSNELWQEMATQGQSFFNASGDADAYTSYVPSPGDNPYITIVGGTTLGMTTGGGAYVSEVVWNQSYYQGVGSSGGISRYYTIPSWQAPIDMSTNGGSTTYRNLPDVGACADNVTVYYGGGGSENVTGTSCATPLYAAFFALVNEKAVDNSLSYVGFANPPLYTIGGGPLGALLFHDTIVGNNEWRQSPSQFIAVAGYDLCTGFGSPTGALIDALLGLATSVPASVSHDMALRVAPDPSSGPMVVSFENRTAGATRVTILDVSGRVVRVLMNGSQPAGRYSLSWDARNDAGSRMPGGVYLTRVETAGGVQTGKVVLSR